MKKRKEEIEEKKKKNKEKREKGKNKKKKRIKGKKKGKRKPEKKKKRKKLITVPCNLQKISYTTQSERRLPKNVKSFQK